MRRAIRALTLAVFAVAFAWVSGHTEAQVVQRINGIGIVDYSHKPTFKVGDWVRYRMSGESAMGMRDDYELTLVIAGEEEWWGEECFWVETWTDAKGRAPETAATLMSYAIFEDSAAIQHMQSYQRKSISGVDMNGLPIEEITRPAASALKTRSAYQRPLMWNVDTLEADTVQTPAGTFQTRKVSIKQGTAVTSNMPDSTLYTEVRENRMSWFTLDVPITHIAREDVENTISRRSWMIGRSAEGSPLRLKERGTGSARLIGMGHGMKARMLVPERQKSLAQWRAEAAKKQAAAGAPARTGAKRR
ncbi:MAG: hypothetical protein HZA61_16245 [Candidatus Eisenbacteria bacterium]|uniref:DUF3108 domain-containing protein n=1 Tax=Eiseniibacteriota bacterium TaxID=2212470 RepID=A0A933SF90_UNCEI|nr:hypothetical protein [Candidatus Eisenbacteria bacterium]